MIKIALTGGAGFIGSHIAYEYMSNNYQVFIIDNFSTGKKSNIPNNIKIYEADINNQQDIEKIFRLEKPQILNHQAAQINVRKSINNPAEDANTNIIGGLNLLKASADNQVQKIIFASSAAVYGNTDSLPTTEQTIPCPINPYGISKLTFEKYLDFFSKYHKIPFNILRYSNVYGPKQNMLGEAGVISIFIDNILKNKPLEINGDGEQTRDFIFVEDIARLNLTILQQENSKIFNASSKTSTSINQLASTIKRITNKDFEINHNNTVAEDIRHSCLDNSLILQNTNWKPTCSLSDGLEQTIAYFQKQHEKNSHT